MLLWTKGHKYIEIELDWDYDDGYMHLSMQSYLNKSHQQFQNLIPSVHQDSPYPHTPLKYGVTEQFAEYNDSPPCRTRGENICSESEEKVFMVRRKC